MQCLLTLRHVCMSTCTISKHSVHILNPSLLNYKFQTFLLYSFIAVEYLCYMLYILFQRYNFVKAANCVDVRNVCMLVALRL